ncbi:MAG: hypothetical protein ACRD0U_02360 [Acidimicrobiales bacterium]
MLVIDEYLAVDVMLGDWPAGLPDDDIIGLPASRHFRLLQRIHQPGSGQLTGIRDRLPEPDRQAMLHPHPEVLQVLDPRPLLDEAAAIGARYRRSAHRRDPRRRPRLRPPAVVRHRP